jgi:molybdate transport system substrate-binding protein
VSPDVVAGNGGNSRDWKGNSMVYSMRRFTLQRRLVFIVLILVALVVITPACSGGSSSTLTVFAAAGAKPALDEICAAYREKSNVVVEVTYGGGGEVLSQLELDRSGDVYVAPEQSFMQKAVEKQLVVPEIVTAIAWMVPVIAVPVENPQSITKLEDLARPGVRVAVTRPETTLLGKYAPEIFEKAGLADAIGQNIVTEAARPDSLLTMLVMGQVDAAILWNFYEVQSADDVAVIYLAPEQLTGIGEMRAAVTSFTENEDEAQRFVDFLGSPEVKKIFEELGYIVDGEVLQKYWH